MLPPGEVRTTEVQPGTVGNKALFCSLVIRKIPEFVLEETLKLLSFYPCYLPLAQVTQSPIIHLAYIYPCVKNKDLCAGQYNFLIKH